MSKFIEEFWAKHDAELIKKEEEKKAILQETVSEVRKNLGHVERPTFSKQMDTHFNIFKAVLCECVGNLYLDSLVLDDPYKYSNVLKESVDAEMTNIMSDCKNPKDVFVLFENAGNYIQSAMILAESIAAETSAELMEKVKEYKEGEFKKDELLTPEAKKQIDDFEAIEGKSDVADEIQARVIDVYKKEEDIAKEKQEKTQELIDKLADKDGGTLSESTIAAGINSYSNFNVHQSLFQSIYMNRSRVAIQENAGTLVDNKDMILAESICAYTLLECIHSLGIKPYTMNEKQDMISKINLGLM